MLKSIIEIRKLFAVEGLENGQVNVRTSEYLLSLPDHQQAKVLTGHLDNLREDLKKLNALSHDRPLEKADEVQRTQLQILIQIVEGLLSQIGGFR